MGLVGLGPLARLGPSPRLTRGELGPAGLGNGQIALGRGRRAWPPWSTPSSPSDPGRPATRPARLRSGRRVVHGPRRRRAAPARFSRRPSMSARVRSSATSALASASLLASRWARITSLRRSGLMAARGSVTGLTSNEPPSDSGTPGASGLPVGLRSSPRTNRSVLASSCAS